MRAAQRALVRTLALLLAALWVVGLPASASAADAALPEGDFVATYTGKLATSWGGSETTHRSIVELTCRDGSCTHVETTSVRKTRSEPMPQGPTITHRSTRTYDPFAESRTQCPDFRQTFTSVFTATAQRATLRTTGAPVKMQCSDGAYARSDRFVARFEGALTDLKQDESGQSGTDDPASAGSGGTGADTIGNGAGSSTGSAVVSSSQLESGDAGAPSVLSALPTVADTAPNAKQTLALVVLVVILVLLIAFPTHLLNSAMESGHEKLSALRRRRRSVPEDAVDAPPVASVRTWAVAAAVVLAASLISAFVDPGFGFNPGSLRVLGSLFLALAVESLLVWFAVILVTRRTSPDTVAGFHAAPATLLVVALAVVLTRLTGFEPGIIFGLVAGVTFAAAAGAAAQGRVALAGTALALGLALAGWVGYSMLGPAASDSGFARTFVTETLSSLAIAGIASLPLALIPLRGMTGHTLYSWSKPLWAVSYGIGLAGFFLVLMPMPFSWSAVGIPLRTWILLYLGYAVAAVVAWAALTQPWRKDSPEPAV